jgi:hypothetical protein
MTDGPVGPRSERWATKDGHPVISFEEHVAKASAERSSRLVFYIDTESRVPAWTQLVLLFLKHKILRLPMR